MSNRLSNIPEVAAFEKALHRDKGVFAAASDVVENWVKHQFKNEYELGDWRENGENGPPAPRRWPRIDRLFEHPGEWFSDLTLRRNLLQAMDAATVALGEKPNAQGRSEAAYTMERDGEIFSNWIETQFDGNWVYKWMAELWDNYLTLPGMAGAKLRNASRRSHMSRTATSVVLPALRGAPTPKWIADMEQAIMRDKTIEARGLENKIEMLAWDLGYEEMAGGDPRYYASQFKLVQALAAEQGMGRVVEKEHKDGLRAGREQAGLELFGRLIRMAAELPKGDAERRKILAVLKTARFQGIVYVYRQGPSLREEEADQIKSDAAPGDTIKYKGKDYKVSEKTRSKKRYIYLERDWE